MGLLDSFLRHTPSSCVGIDLGAGGIKVVELRQEKKRPVLFTYGFTESSHDIHHLLTKQEKTADDLLPAKVMSTKKAAVPTFTIDDAKIETYANLVKTVCREARVQAKSAVVSIPVSAVFHAVVTLPPTKKEDFKKILQAELKKLLPYPLEEATVEHSVLFSNEHMQRVLVNAAPLTLIAFYTKVLKQAGFNTNTSVWFESESIALARALVGRDQSTVMVVDIGAERTNFYIVESGAAITHHSIEVGGERMNQLLGGVMGIGQDIVEQTKRDIFSELVAKPSALGNQKFLELLMPVIDPIVKEIGFSFELYLRQSGNERKNLEKIILTGGGALCPYLPDYISTTFKMKCYVGDPWGRVVYQESLRPVLRSIAPRMAVAIGLALRNMV